jgi:hypothetical protein
VGRLWDGKDLPLSERIGPSNSRDALRDVPEDGVDSFLGRVDFRQIGNARGKHLYDVLLYADGAGTIFEAGGFEDIGYMGDQIGLKLHHDDVALRLGLVGAFCKEPKRFDTNSPAPKRAPSTKKSAGAKPRRRTPGKR